MIAYLAAWATELGLTTLASGAAITVNMASATKPRRQPLCMPMGDDAKVGTFLAGNALSMKDLRKPKYRRYKNFVLRHGKEFGLSAKQRQFLRRSA